MAGERKGDAFEALTALALENLGYVLGYTAHWGQKPKGFSIDTDFLIGDISSPSTLILATSTTSVKNTPEKFWRNIGELFEAKRTFTPIPCVLNLVFEAQQMEQLQRSMSSLADAELIVQKEWFGPNLINLITSFSQDLPKEKLQKLDSLRNFYKSNSEFRSVVDAFSNQLKNQLARGQSTKLSALWTAARSRPNGTPPAARKTFIRRGIAKMIVIPKDLRNEVINGKSQGLKNVPIPLMELGIFQETITGATLVDREIIEARNLLNKDDLQYLVESALASRPGYWNSVSSELLSTELAKRHAFLIDNYQSLCSAQGMEQNLRTVSPEGPRWLFWHIIEVLKSTSGLRQAYGFAVLSQDVGYSSGISSGYKTLADWANGVTKTKLPDRLIPDVSVALARRIKQVGLASIKCIGETISKSYRENLLEQKIVAYVKFEPLPYLILRHLAPVYPDAAIRKHPTFLGEIVDTPNQITTPIIAVSKTIIHWKSAYDKGRKHKTKELAGRADALRFEWSSGRIGPRKNIKKQILVLDGTFSTDQLASLISAGWDDIFYPDEMDRLVKAIV